MKFFHRRHEPATDAAPATEVTSPPEVVSNDKPTSDAVPAEPAGSAQPAQQDHDGALVLRADLPGFDPESEIAVTVTDGLLLIEAEQRKERHTEGDGYVRHELRLGAVRQAVPLPPEVRPDDIAATYEQGVLEIRIPKPLGVAQKIPVIAR